MYHFSDELEKEVAETLLKVGVKFNHASNTPNQRLDFYLLDYDIFIEVKKFHSERSNSQLSSQDNIILIQGRKSVELFCTLLKLPR